MDQCSRIASSEIEPQKDVQLIFDKYTEAVQQRKESIFSHDAEPIGHHKQKKELCLKLHLLCKN